MEHSDVGKAEFALYIRSFTFGVEDSLVSTVGLLSGIAAAGVARSDLLVTGAVLISVEALSMAVGSFLSENSAEEYIAQGKASSSRSLVAGGIMFSSYFVSGLIPLFPYFLISGQAAFYVSIAASLGALFILGFVSALFFKAKVLRGGLRMLFLGGIAVLTGIIIGQFIHRK